MKTFKRITLATIKLTVGVALYIWSINLIVTVGFATFCIDFISSVVADAKAIFSGVVISGLWKHLCSSFTKTAAVVVLMLANPLKMITTAAIELVEIFWDRKTEKKIFNRDAVAA